MRYKVCNSCGKKYKDGTKCSCQVKHNNEYSKSYYETNKERKKLLNSKRWRDLRERVIKRDGGMCNRCWSSLGIIENNNLQVHHIKPRSEYPELMFETDNLITVCKTCNLTLGVSGKIDWEIIRFNEDFDEPTI